MTLLGVAVIGVGVGLLGGMFGKGGSSVATPLLHLIGVPAIAAVASPLPATIPSTLSAGWAYWRAGMVDWRVVRWCTGVGVPATIAGALATRWVSGEVLVDATDVVLIGLGLRLVLNARKDAGELEEDVDETTASLVGVGAVVGVVSGLLANSGGFLLAPLFVTVLRRPIKVAFASSLIVAATLALPGTVVHTALGHVDWQVVVVFAVTSVPLSFLGARLALRSDPARLERVYGLAIMLLGAVLLAAR